MCMKDWRGSRPTHGSDSSIILTVSGNPKTNNNGGHGVRVVCINLYG